MNKILLAFVSILLSSSVSAASISYQGNNSGTLVDGSNAIAFHNVKFNALVGGSFWFNTRWSSESPVIYPNGVDPAYVNLYAPDVKSIGSTLYCWYGGWTDFVANGNVALDRIYYSTPSGSLGSWSQPSVAIDKGSFDGVNDPSVAYHNGYYQMFYTYNPSGGTFLTEWIARSRSTNGSTWTPS